MWSGIIIHNIYCKKNSCHVDVHKACTALFCTFLLEKLPMMFGKPCLKMQNKSIYWRRGYCLKCQTLPPNSYDLNYLKSHPFCRLALQSFEFFTPIISSIRIMNMAAKPNDTLYTAPYPNKFAQSFPAFIFSHAVE